MPRRQDFSRHGDLAPGIFAPQPYSDETLS